MSDYVNKTKKGNVEYDIHDARIADASVLVTTSDLATVATTGDYDDLLDKPTIPDAVEANPTVPSGTTPTALTGLKIGDGYYGISGGGGGVETDPVFTASPAYDISSGDITAWNAKYDKPSGGIPSTDLASAVQTSLGKADTALQSFTEADPVFSASAAAGIQSSDISAWNAKYDKPAGGIPSTDLASGVIPDISTKQDTLVSGTNIKTVDGTSILGSGNLVTSATHPWAGAVMNFVGDSITEGANLVTTVTAKYWQDLATMLGGTSYADGISGSVISNITDRYPMCYRVINNNKLSTNADLVFVFGGTNDFNRNVAIGNQFNTDGNGVKTLNLDDTTFYGALNVMARNLIAGYPYSTIVLLTPIHRKNFESQPTDFAPNGIGKYLSEYVDAVKNVAKWFSFVCIDLFGEGALYPHDTAQQMAYFGGANEGLHPNNLGHQMLADVIYAKLKDIQKKRKPASFSAISGITVAGANSLLTNNDIELTAAITPSGADFRKVSWSVSDSTKATISPFGTYCKVHGVAAGSVTVTCSSTDGSNKSGTKSITVSSPAVVTGITISGDTAVSIGGSITLTAALTPNGISADKVTWSVNNENATISASGASCTVTGVSTGNVVVTCQSVDDASVNDTYNVAVTTTYSVSTSVTNGSYSGSTTIASNGTASVTITPSSGYKLPTSVTVEGATQSYNASTGVISLSAPTGNITISATCPALAVYNITNNITNGTASGASTITEETVENITISPDTGYALPSSVTVSGASYTYDQTTGVIQLSHPDNDINITVVCVSVPTYNITNSITGGTASGDATINQGGTATVTIAPSSGNYYPSSVTVVNATYEYNKHTGVVSLSAPTGDVSITATCVAVATFNITQSITGGSTDLAATATQGTTVTGTLTASAGNSLPGTITVTGCAYTYNSTSGAISLSNFEDDVTITATCPQAVVWYSDSRAYGEDTNKGPAAVFKSGTCYHENREYNGHTNHTFYDGCKVNMVRVYVGTAGNMIFGRINEGASATLKESATVNFPTASTVSEVTGCHVNMIEMPLGKTFTLGSGETMGIGGSNIGSDASFMHYNNRHNPSSASYRDPAPGHTWVTPTCTGFWSGTIHDGVNGQALLVDYGYDPSLDV